MSSSLWISMGWGFMAMILAMISLGESFTLPTSQQNCAVQRKQQSQQQQQQQQPTHVLFQSFESFELAGDDDDDDEADVSFDLFGDDDDIEDGGTVMGGGNTNFDTNPAAAGVASFSAPAAVGGPASFSAPSQDGYMMSDEEEDEEDDEEAWANRLSDEDLMATMEPWDDRIARFNTISLVGRVGNNPDPRYFDDGKVVVNLSLACTRKYHYLERQFLGIQSGEEETNWYGLEIWGTTAEFVSKYVDKGARVGVTGSLQIDSWTDKQTGEPRTKPKVIVREFDILETKAEADMRRSRSGGGGGGGGGGGYQGGNGGGGGGGGYQSGRNNQSDQFNPARGGDGGFFD